MNPTQSNDPVAQARANYLHALGALGECSLNLKKWREREADARKAALNAELAYESAQREAGKAKTEAAKTKTEAPGPVATPSPDTNS